MLVFGGCRLRAEAAAYLVSPDNSHHLARRRQTDTQTHRRTNKRTWDISHRRFPPSTILKRNKIALKWVAMTPTIGLFQNMDTPCLELLQGPSLHMNFSLQCPLQADMGLDGHCRGCGRQSRSTDDQVTLSYDRDRPSVLPSDNRARRQNQYSIVISETRYDRGPVALACVRVSMGCLIRTPPTQ